MPSSTATGRDASGPDGLTKLAKQFIFCKPNQTKPKPEILIQSRMGLVGQDVLWKKPTPLTFMDMPGIYLTLLKG